MIDKANLIQQIDESTALLIQTILSIEEPAFNKKKSEESWSPADIAEHILLLESKVNLAMQNAHPTERAADGKLDAMKQGLTSFETKYKAPDFVLPGKHLKNKSELIGAIKDQREVFKQLIETFDLSQSTELKHPYIGAMTRLEWIYFVIYHTQRHVQQIKMMLPSEASSS